MWWILQIAACAVVIAADMYARRYGWSLQSYLVVVGANACFASWAFIRSFELAPSFMTVWFIGSAALALFGLLGSVLFFRKYWSGGRMRE